MNHWLNPKQQSLLAGDLETEKRRLESEIESLSVEELFLLGAIYDRLNDPRKAKSILLKILQKSFGHVPSLYALSLLQFEDKKTQEARRWYLRALHFDQPETASEATLFIHSRLRTRLSVVESGGTGMWLLQSLYEKNKSSHLSLFEFGKMLFERSQFEESADVMRRVVEHPELCFEATQYLSYIYERLYKGDELIEKTLDLAKSVKECSDLFFNLAMLTQHDEQRPEASLCLFYLASQADPHDPGLRFSLEQACLEVIGRIGKSPRPMDQFYLMIAHLFHGSLALSKRYAQILRDRHQWRFPESFKALGPERLWQEWLLPDQGLLGEALQQWFGQEAPEEGLGFVRELRSRTPQEPG